MTRKCERCGRSDVVLVSAYDADGEHWTCEPCRAEHYTLADWYRAPKEAWSWNEVID